MTQTERPDETRAPRATERYKLLVGSAVRQMTSENIIDWIAQLAADGKAWGFLKEELLRRLRR